MADTQRHDPASFPDRRGILKAGLAGLIAVPWLPDFAAGFGRAALPAARADAVIHIFLRGGLSHIDSFDPKPFAPVEVRGDLGTVASRIDKEPFGALWRRTAAVADRLCVLRAMTHGEAAHERGVHNMLTGYRPSPAITYPSMGSVVAHELGGQRDLPPYVCVPSADDAFLGTGYLGSAFGPFSVGGEPQQRGFSVRDLGTAKGIDDGRKARRRRFVSMLDEGFGAAGEADPVRALDAFYEQAYGLIDSPTARKAFDIKDEPKKVRDAYGMTRIGQRLLLARRLVEGGSRWIYVADGGYDMHRGLVGLMRRTVPPVDQGYSTLIRDLDDRGMLDRTLVVLSTEFGRTPRMNRDRGRDHWPRVFSVVLAGGGVRRGLIHGRSDSAGAEPEHDATTPADLAATTFHLLGIDPERKLLSPGDRPIDIVRDGKILKPILV
jgi:hypothetical protein